MIFKSKKKKSVNKIYFSERNIKGYWFAVFKLMNATDNVVPFVDWSRHENEGADWLFNLVERNEINKEKLFVDRDLIYIEMDELVHSIEGQEVYLQMILELPSLFDGGIDVKGYGLIHNDDFSINYNWILGNSRPIQAIRSGAVLSVGQKKYWLTSHAYYLSKTIDALKKSIANKNSFYEKLIELSEFKSLVSLLPPAEQDKIKQSSELEGLKLFYANAFRIEAIPEHDGYNFRPVLLRRHIDSIDSNPIFECVLTPAEQDRYADHFFNSTKTLLQYSLGVAKYILINQDLDRVLRVVHKKQHASVKERESFLKNPKGALSEDLDDIFDEDALSCIFSDRVVGIGEWQDKIVPWIKIPSQDWIPDGKFPDGERGISIGESKLIISPEQAELLVKQMKIAINKGLSSVEFQGQTIPANTDSIHAIHQIIPAKPIDYQSPTKNQASVEDDRLSKSIILVKENLGTLEYVVHRANRNNYPKNTDIPDLLRTEPKQHQRDAFKWLIDHYIVGSRGALLADDMGLGKSFQALIFLAWLHESMQKGEIPTRPFLIVAPIGLLKNWELELNIHLLGDLGHLLRVYGTDIQKIKKNMNLDTNQLSNAGMVLTTYDTLTKYQTSFSTVTFATVVFDEIQKLKNPGILNYNAACGLKSEFWIGMTGTPVENRLCDLWSISDILQPGMLGTIKEFSQKYEKSILIDKQEAEYHINHLQRTICHPNQNAPAFMLRRMKHDQLPDLPPKYIEEYTEVMPQEQAKMYSDILNYVKNSSQTKKGLMLEALHKLRACSLHPDYKRVNRKWEDKLFIEASARLKVCFNILEKIRKKNEKALIFIEYNDWHRQDFLPKIIQRYFSLNDLPMVIYGQIDSKTRQNRVNQFQKDEGKFDVMLLSPKAGGVGLTLTAANHVIHLTRWWNPAVEDQATDRIYRIGQERPVYIHYPMAIHPELNEHSFDIILNNILKGKRLLRDQTLIIPPQVDDIAEEIMKKTFEKDSSSKNNLKESYFMTGQEYEQYVLEKLQSISRSFGYIVRGTGATRDGGADITIQTENGEIVALIQCKHVSSENHLSGELSQDLERAVRSYGASDKVWKIGITNALKITNLDSAWSEKSDRHLIVNGDNGLNPEKMVFQHL